ncbi:MAG: baseplate J/gp47 family protein [Candidatus Gastranaerophilales bacterium]|nr:baseplate J/gp47 family protein [Candidatus Gastranaerophilales bacterium]
MSLPEPSFIDRDIDKITKDWIALYEQKTGKVLQPAQIERVLIDVGVYRESLLRIAIQEAAKQNLVNFATYPMLDYLGELVGVERLQPQYAKTIIRFAMDEAEIYAIDIPSGSQIESKDGKVIFTTLNSTTIPPGQLYADVPVQCETAGEIGNNYLSGEINSLLSNLPDINSVSNISVTSGGADEEENDPYRERIKQAPEQFSNAGSRGAYEYLTKSAHQDIIDVAVINPTAGVVKVYPLTKSGNPTSEIINAVSNILDDDTKRPLTDLVIVESPLKIDFSITADVTIFDWADQTLVKAEIELKLDAYISDLKLKLGKDIVPAQIISIILGVSGVYNVNLVNPAYQALDESEWANCVSRTVNIAGVVNG